MISLAREKISSTEHLFATVEVTYSSKRISYRLDETEGKGNNADFCGNNLGLGLMDRFNTFDIARGSPSSSLFSWGAGN